jgi:2-methylcitrate dehydratase PrpD
MAGRSEQIMAASDSSSEQTALQRLAAWASSVGPEHTPAARRAAAVAIADVIVCMIAGATEEGVRRARTTLSLWGSGQASLVGCASGVAPTGAALLNGMAAHVLDFDDAFQQGNNHPTAVFLPALLALGEETNASGADLIDAYIVGFELLSGLARGCMRSHYDAGWHTTSTLGCIAAAGACSRLLGLDAHRIGHAMSIAVTIAGGCKVQFGTMAKPLHAGFAAQHAVTAAKLAAAQVEGRLSALEGPMGFLDLFGGPSPNGWGENLDSLGSPLAIDARGLLLKRFPCCSSTHRTVDNLLELKAESGFSADDVVSIDAWVGFGNARNLMYPAPVTEFEARFSMQYCVAAALLFDTLKLSDFTPETIWRPEVRALFPLIRMHAYEAKDELRNTDLMRPHMIEIVLRDGRKLTRSRAMPVGSKDDPLKASDHRIKFDDCCSISLSPQHREELRAALDNLETIRLPELGKLLRFDADAVLAQRASGAVPMAKAS